MNKWLLAISRLELPTMVSQSCELPPLLVARRSVLARVPLPTTRVPVPVIPAIVELTSATVHEPLLTTATCSLALEESVKGSTGPLTTAVDPDATLRMEPDETETVPLPCEIVAVPVSTILSVPPDQVSELPKPKVTP